MFELTNFRSQDVPTYNPWDVYGDPIAPYPGFAFVGALGDFFFAAFPSNTDSASLWELSTACRLDGLPGAAIGGATGLLFNHSGYYTHSRQSSLIGAGPGDGPRAYYGRGENGGTARRPIRTDGQYRL